MSGTMAANADVIYDFSGACETVCDGVSTWTGVLDLAPSFAAGSEISSSNFVSFTLTTDGESFNSVAGSVGPFPGVIFVSNPAGGLFFGPTSAGQWAVSVNGSGGLGDQSGDDLTWTLESTPVPNPPTLPLLGLGLGVIGFMTRRNRKGALPPAKLAHANQRPPPSRWSQGSLPTAGQARR